MAGLLVGAGIKWVPAVKKMTELSISPWGEGVAKSRVSVRRILGKMTKLARLWTLWVVFNTIHGMAFLFENSAWKDALLVAVLVVFVCVGIAAVINPDSFIRRSGLPKGGEMLTEWNRFGCRLSGAAFAGVAMYMLYAFLRDVLAK